MLFENRCMTDRDQAQAQQRAEYIAEIIRHARHVMQRKAANLR